MQRLIVLAALVYLGGCAQMADYLAPPYVPAPIHIYNSKQYAADVAECEAAGNNWTPSFSVGSAASSTVDGATSNTSLIPITPLVMAYGAAGGAAKAAADGLDVASGQHANVFRNCLHDETQIDGSAVVADPNQR